MGAGVTLALLGAASRSWGQESIAQEEPPPASVEQSETPMERSFRILPERPGLFPRLREEMKDLPPFFRDTKIDVNLRTYYRNAKQFDGSQNEAWAGGGALSYRSGWLFDRLSLGAVLYTSQPLFAPADRDGTGLLKPGQDGYTALGQLYGRVRVSDELFLNLYRYIYDTPYLNRDDSRMTPKTFEGYTFNGTLGGKDGGPGLRYGAGYITKIKDKNSDSFVWMSQQAGARVDRGVGVAGALFTYGRGSIGAIDYYSDDIIHIGYAEAKYVLPVSADFGVLFAAQFTDQRSAGADLLKGFPFATNQFGLKTEMSYAGALLTLAYTRNATGADLQNPWSGYPGYTSVMVQSFKGAGENAFMVKGSYDFSRLGAQGLTAYGLFTHGWGLVSPATKASLPNMNEVDADVQWRPEWSLLNGLWLRARYAFVQQYQGARSTAQEIRLTANYGFSIL
jgi:outer membrane OprD family porin